MTRERLRCFVSGQSDPAHPHAFPDDEDHPFWDEIDRLADAIHARLVAAGAVETAAMARLLTMSSDTPRGCAYFWVDLSADANLRHALLTLCLEHLARARLCLPNVAWEVHLEEMLLDWDGARFSLPA